MRTRDILLIFALAAILGAVAAIGQNLRHRTDSYLYARDGWYKTSLWYQKTYDCGTDTECETQDDILLCRNNPECEQAVINAALMYMERSGFGLTLSECLRDGECGMEMWAAAVDYSGERDVDYFRAKRDCSANPNLISIDGYFCEDF